jgi:hypothetical protein
MDLLANKNVLDMLNNMEPEQLRAMMQMVSVNAPSPVSTPSPVTTASDKTTDSKKKVLTKVKKSKVKPATQPESSKDSGLKDSSLSNLESMLSRIDLDKLRETAAALPIHEVSASSKKQPNMKELAKQNVVYKGFNDKMVEIVEKFATKLPEQATFYGVIRRGLEAKIAMDVTEPMTLWLQHTKGHTHCFKQCNEENVKYFLANVKDIKLLSPLNIEQNWPRFKPSDIEALWVDLGELNLLSEVTDTVGPKLMNSIQKMTGLMQMKGQINGSTLNLDKGTLTGLLKTAITSSPEVLADMAELQQELQQKTSTALPLPPIMHSIISKMQDQ